MNNITIEFGKGLQSRLIDILKPIKTIKENCDNQSRIKIEFIGVIDNPIQKIKDYGHGVFECLNIISVD